MNNAMSSEEIHSMLVSYKGFKDEVHRGKLGKNAWYWFSYMGNIRSVLRLTYDVRTSNFILCCECLCMMSSLLISFDVQNYADYEELFSVFLANVEEAHSGTRQLLEGRDISFT